MFYQLSWFSHSQLVPYSFVGKRTYIFMRNVLYILKDTQVSIPIIFFRWSIWHYYNENRKGRTRNLRVINTRVERQFHYNSTRQRSKKYLSGAMITWGVKFWGACKIFKKQIIEPCLEVERGWTAQSPRSITEMTAVVKLRWTAQIKIGDSWK